MKLHFKDFFTKLDKLGTPIYFFTGPGDYLKFRARERLLARDAFKDYAKTKLNPKELDPQALSSHISESTLFGAGEILIFDGIDKIKVVLKQQLLEILDALEEQNDLSKILLFISNNERTDAADPLEGHFLASQLASHIYFPLLTIEEVASWAKGEFKRREIVVSQELLEKVSVVYGNDLYLWSNLLERTALFLAGGKKLSTKDIEELLAASSTQEDILLERLEGVILNALKNGASGDDLRSLTASLRDFFVATKDPPQTSCIRILWLLSDIVYELGLTKSGSARHRRFVDKKAMLIKDCAPKINWEKIQDFYKTFLEAERQIKTGALEPTIAIQECLSNLWESLIPV